MARINFGCVWCGKTIWAPEALAGKSAKCAKCGLIVQVPSARPLKRPVADAANVTGDEGSNDLLVQYGLGAERACPCYLIILKSPPKPADEQWYISQVISTLCPEATESKCAGVRFVVTDAYADEHCIASEAVMATLSQGIRIDIEKLTYRSFTDASGGEGTLIKCYK